MKIILSSDDSELRDILNSYDFNVVNSVNDYDEQGNFISSSCVLKELPRVGDFLYFTDNYYKQIAVEVVRISFNSNRSKAMVYLRRVSLNYIDSYMYSHDNSLNEKFRLDVIDFFYTHKKSIEKFVNEQKGYYVDQKDSPDFELVQITYFIAEHMDSLQNTIIDFQNVRWAISDIISKRFPTKYNWHRPWKFEFSED